MGQANRRHATLLARGGDAGRLLVGLLLAGWLALAAATPAAAHSDPTLAAGGPSGAPSGARAAPARIYVDGLRLSPDVDPVIEEGRILVPVRFIAEALGAEVDWDAEARVATFARGGTVVAVPIGAPHLRRGGDLLPLDVPSRIVGGRTMLPLRALSEAFGLHVRWMEVARAAWLQSGPLPPFEVVAYYVQYAPDDLLSLRSLQAHADQVDYVAAAQYRIDGDGGVRAEVEPTELMRWARARDLKLLALVHNIGPGGFDRAMAHRLLSDPARRRAAVENVVALLREGGFAGVNVDLENLEPGDRAAYSAFIAELAARLRPLGLLTTASIPAKERDDPGAGWSGAFDYRAIGAAADRVMVMTYDEHYGGGPVGPVASVPWVERVIRYASSEIPAERLVLGIAGYGYEWPAGTAAGGGRAVPARRLAEAVRSGELEAAWDHAAQVPTYRRGERVGYFEDADSTAFKLEVVRRHRLAGVALWRLGYEDARLWDDLARRAPRADVARRP